jgi:ribosomal subunit interface protein
LRVQITTRQCDVPAETRERTIELVKNLTRFDDDLLSADVVFRLEGVESQVDAVLSIARSDRVAATGRGADFLAASDDLTDKLKKILRRRGGKARDRARSGTA